MKKALVPLAILGGIGVLWKWRRDSNPERSIDKVMHSITKSDLPDRSKKRMLHTLDTARDGMQTLRESASDMAKRVS